MSTNRRWSGYTLFPTCSPPSAVVDDLNRLSAQSAGCEGYDYLTLRKAAAALAPRENEQDKASANDKRPTNNPIVLVKRKSVQTLQRLIPLRLSSLSVASLSSFSTPSPSVEATGHPPKPIKKSRPGPVTQLIILPYTAGDWRTVMNEVKELHLKGQYKHCSMRCKQILDGIRDSSHVHPLYPTYLCFFAASSLEMTASSLHNHSSTKLPLYQEALSYYQEASSHLVFASVYTKPNLMHASESGSMPSSVRSSVDSVFSYLSTQSSVASSPTLDQEHAHDTTKSSSYSSDEDLTSSHRRTSPHKKHKKKVSFSIAALASPFGPELMAPSAYTDEAMLLDAFPIPPSQSYAEFSAQQDQSHDLSPPDHASHHSRYLALLGSLSHQLTYHITSIHASIADLSATRKTRRNGVSRALSSGDGESGVGAAGASAEEVKQTDLKERIRRLKEGGWQRKRFDGERYRVLAERAMEEVALHRAGRV